MSILMLYMVSLVCHSSKLVCHLGTPMVLCSPSLSYFYRAIFVCFYTRILQSDYILIYVYVFLVILREKLNWYSRGWSQIGSTQHCGHQ
jgi:formate-dependent nitrite reductase membrane component NrfD